MDKLLTDEQIDYIYPEDRREDVRRKPPPQHLSKAEMDTYATATRDTLEGIFVRRLIVRVRSLEDELRAAQDSALQAAYRDGDSKRLDWLQENFCFDETAHAMTLCVGDLPAFQKDRVSLREAIDAAIARVGRIPEGK